MDFNFTEEQKMLRSAIREFVENEIAPNAAKWDEEDVCPAELFPKMGEMGMTGVFVPEEYGGVGLGHVERAIVLEEVSRHSAGLGIALMTHHLGLSSILNFGTEEQKKKYLPELAAGKKICGLAVTEPTGGSDLMNHGTEAKKQDGKWVLNGRKCFITNSHIADVSVVTAKSGVNERGRNELSAFIIEKGTEGFAPGRKENKLGLRGSTTGDVIMKEVVLEEDALVGKEGKGHVVAMTCIGEVGRAGMTAIAVGILRGCLEEALEFAETRILYGKPLNKLQAIQFIIAETRIDYEAAKLMLYKAATLKDSGEPAATEFCMAKYFSGETAIKAAKKTIDLMGGYGIINEYPVGRFLRDALACAPSGGTNDIQKVVVAGATIKGFEA